MRRLPKHLLVAGFLVALALLAGMAVLAVRFAREFEATGRWVLHTQDVRLHLASCFRYLSDVEGSASAFLLSRDPKFEPELEAAARSMQQSIGRLRTLTVDNFEQQQRLLELERRFEVWSDAARASLRAAAAGDVGDATVRQQIQRRQEMRWILEAMEAAEEELLYDRLEAAERQARRTLVTFGVALALDFLLAGLLAYALWRDRRARESANEALRAAAVQVEDLYNRAPCGYHSLDENGVFTMVNDTELAWLGCTRDEIVGRKRLTDFLTDESRQKFAECFPRFKATGRVVDLEFDLVTKSGELLPVVINSTAIYDAAGRYHSSRSTLFDNTHRRRAERLIIDSRAHAESIVDTLREPLLVLTEDLCVRSANRAYYQLFCARPEETVGVPLRELGRGQWDVPALLDRLARVVPENHVIDGFEVSRDFPLIGTRVMLLNARKLYRVGNHTTFTLLAMEDITERKRAHDELEAFSYSVSHDLRAPLRHIGGFAGMLEAHLKGRMDEKAERLLRTISDSAKRMGQLIDDLLLFSRIGRAEMHRRTVSLDDLVREARQTLAEDTSKRVIRWEVDPLPAVDGDAALLQQVFANLLGNAVKYTRRCEEAVISVTSKPDPGYPGEVLITVSDNGAGFDMRYVEKLFGVFQRLHSAGEFEGTGVGLANVRRIVQRHGGRVWAEGAPGRGATFHLTLPAAGPAQVSQDVVTP